jgi:hypothetical protein
MPRVRKPTVAEPEIVVMPGNPLVIGQAPRARTISAAFLNSYNDHFNEEGRGIFAKIYKDYPVDYFWGLITLAKVMKVEIGGPHEFDRPSTKEEDKLDRLGRSTRELLDLIERIGKAGAAFRSLGDPLFDTTSSQGRLLSTLLAAIADFERDLIRERTGEGRKRAMAAGVKFGRKRKLSDYQRAEAIKRRDAGETLAAIAKSYGVDISMISRL